jgi:hypothetical protein
MLNAAAQHRQEIEKGANIHYIGEIGQCNLFVAEYRCCYDRKSGIFGTADGDGPMKFSPAFYL